MCGSDRRVLDPKIQRRTTRCDGLAGIVVGECWPLGREPLIAAVSVEKIMRRIVAVSMVGILLGIGSDFRAARAAEVKESASEVNFEWGKENRGQLGSLRALTPAPQPGEPIEFEVRVKNVSDKDTHLPSGLGSERMSACFWTFYFDQWEWRTAQLSCQPVPLKPGETASVRCLVATTGDSLTADQKDRFRFSPPAQFRHVLNKTESDRLPEGTYRVRAMLNDQLESNLIEVRIKNRR